MNAANMTPGIAYESHTMDFTARVQHAVRADGAVFKRVQYRDSRYGYKWTSWTHSESLPAFASYSGRKVRLPKDF